MASERWNQWLSFGRTASAVVILGAAGLTLGWISESAAQGSQTWEFRGFIGSSGVVSPLGPSPFTQTGLVSNGGNFALSVPCPLGGTFQVAGFMTGTQVGATTLSECGGQLTRPGTLDAAFPAAKSFGGLEIRVSGGSVVTITGRLLGGGTAGNPLVDGATLGDVAVISTSVQNRNIGLRLNSLRGGLGGGASLSGLSLTVKGESVPMASVLAGLLSGGGASADPSKAFGRLGIFANGQGSFGDQATTSLTPGYDFYTAGLTMGADYRFTDQIIFGAALGYLRTKIDRASTVSDSTINGYSLSAYGTYYIKDRFYVDGILTYGRNDYSLDRQSERQADSGSGTTIDRITARTDGDQFSASASGGYDFSAGGLTFGPNGRVTYVHVHIGGYAERGPAGSNAAKIPDQTIESLTTAFGAQATYAISTSRGVLLPLVRAEWEHELRGDSRVLRGSLVSNSATQLTAQTSAPDRDYFNVGGGVTATLPRGISAFVYYEESLGRSNFTNHSFTGGMRFEF